MGCLNSRQGFSHWFGNIHLSGPCNRGCYFCIGQHMMALDQYNNLDTYPLKGLDDFLEECQRRRIGEINLTGTNTEPLLYRHHEALIQKLRYAIDGVTVGIRTNGVMAVDRPDVWRLYDKASVSITSTDPELYRATMGRGTPPDLDRLRALDPDKPLKANVVLCPETTQAGDWKRTLDALDRAGFDKANLREPYGQPFAGNPLSVLTPIRYTFGMPTYEWGNMHVTYWDVHWCEVESVNLYANGRISVDYPITRGHDESGEVKDQTHFPVAGRHREQWVRLKGTRYAR